MSLAAEDLFSVRGRAVLITGGGGGIGRMLSAAFLAGGASVTITGRRQESLRRATDALGPLGDLHVIEGDLSGADGAVAIAAKYRASGRPLDVLINNAGRTWGAPLATFPHAAWGDVLGINVTAPFVLIQELLPLLEQGASADRPARIISIGSIYGLITEVMHTYSYAASKAALHQLTRVLAAELAPRHVLVNAIAPGLFETRMTVKMFETEAARAKTLSVVPLGRGGSAEDIGGLALFLASRAGAYVTGAVIPLDGGVSIGR